MRILLIMDPGIPVPPPHYGGHERLVYMFAEEFSRLGHEVSLLAGPNSKISGKAYSFGINQIFKSKWQRLKEVLFIWKFLIKNSRRYDIIHNFGRLAYLLPIVFHKVHKIMTYGRPVNKFGIKAVTAFPIKNFIFTACSNYCVSTGNVAGNWETVYNAIDFSKYNLTEKYDNTAPLMFLGRLDEIKGVHTAIEVAKATGSQLIIGGNIPSTNDNRKYYDQKISPQFDQKQIVYLGAMNDEEKNFYLGKAKALLFPIEWDEPFGMVMVEAMACGTPVIAFDRGSVPEIIENGKNGFRVNNLEQMINHVDMLAAIDRRGCRDYAFSRFDVKKIANNYLNLVNDGVKS